MQKRQKGFTLIELLAVITVIGILATLSVVGVSGAVKRGRDARRKTDLRQMASAIQIYFDDTGRMPINRSPGRGYWNSSADFLQELVDSSLAKNITRSPNAGPYQYGYYDYGPNNNVGAVLVTSLEGEAPSTGYPGTCRPWPPNTNWCSQSSNTYYCICNPY